MYRYRIWCPDCTGIDPQGCFDGGTELSEDAFETVKEAVDAGYQATVNTIWDFCATDESGKEIEVSD